MRSNRYNRRDVVILTLLILLLATVPLLAVLQYRWLDSVRETSRERLLRGLQASSRQLRNDLSEELAVLKSVLILGPEDTAPLDASRLVEQLAFWKKNAAYPGMLGPVYYHRISGERSVDYLLDLKSGTFLSTGGNGTSSEQSDSLMVPVFGTDSASRLALDGYVEAKLDTAYIVDTVIPALLDRHFGPAESRDYDIYVVRPESKEVLYPVGRAGDRSFYDALAGDQNHAPSADVIEALGPEGSLSFRAQLDQPDQPLLIPDRLQVPLVRNWLDSRVTGTGPGETRHDQGIPQGATGWYLAVRYRNGSLESHVLAVRNRNLAVSGAILTALVAAVVSLFLLYRREQRLAEREREFVATVSHELRTPVAVIYSAAENLESGLVRSEAQSREYGTMIRREGKRLGTMIERVLFYSGIQSGRYAPDSRPFSVRNVVDDTVESFARDARERGLALSTSCALTRDELVGDRAGLQSILENLISNAVKNARSDVRVVVTGPTSPRDHHHAIRRLDYRTDSGRRAKPRRPSRGGLPLAPDRAAGREPCAGYLAISVLDDGPGIPAREARRLFEPFSRLTASVRNQIPGSGLGLNLIRRVVEHSNGLIAIENRTGAGCEVVVYLPWREC